MWANKVVPSNNNNNTVTTTAKNTQPGRNTILPPSNIIDVIIKQSALALEVDILITNEEGANTIYRLRGSTLNWLMLVDCNLGNLGKFDGYDGSFIDGGLTF